jgi:hypothetical protein
MCIGHLACSVISQPMPWEIWFHLNYGKNDHGNQMWKARMKSDFTKLLGGTENIFTIMALNMTARTGAKSDREKINAAPFMRYLKSKSSDLRSIKEPSDEKSLSLGADFSILCTNSLCSD